MNKLFSGRFWFAIVTAAVFAWSSYKNYLSNEQIVTIIMLVVGFYFNRSDRTGGTT